MRLDDYVMDIHHVVCDIRILLRPSCQHHWDVSHCLSVSQSR